MPEANNTPFAELPAALVDEVLTQTKDVSQRLLSAFGDLKNQESRLARRTLPKGLASKAGCSAFCQYSHNLRRGREHVH